MNRKNRQIEYVFLTLLFLFALTTEHIPQLRDKTMVRGAELYRQGGDYRVTLLCHQVTPAANAADAKEQMQAVQGVGPSLAEAYAGAEAQLSGRAVYQQCDLLVLSGPEMLSELEAVSEVVRTQRKGSPSARLLYAPGPWIDPAEETLSRRYADLRKSAENGPCLYEIRQDLLLIPRIAADSARITAVAALEQQQLAAWLSRPAAGLLQGIRRGHGRLELQLRHGRQPLYLMVSCAEQAGTLVRTVYLFPVEDSLQTGRAQANRTQALACVEQLWRKAVRLDQRELSRGNGDAKILWLRGADRGAPRTIALRTQTKFVWMDK